MRTVQRRKNRQKHWDKQKRRRAMHYRYVEATYDVLRYIEAGESPDTAAFRAAQANGLSLTEYGRLARETEERYNES